MNVRLRKIGGIFFAVLLAGGLLVSEAKADKVRIALAETPSDELAAFFVALDRAKAMGLDYEWTAFSDEELAIQAVLSGQMDIGFGTPYAAMQKSKAPIRIIFQLSKLKFFPVTSQKYGKLEDLDGEPIMLHSRGGGTDSIANVIEEKPRHHLRRALLRPRLGQPHRRPDRRSDGRDDRRSLQQEQAGETGGRQVQRPAHVRGRRERRGPVRQSRLDQGQRGGRERSSSRPCSASIGTWRRTRRSSAARPTRTAPIGQLPPEILGSLDDFYTDAVEGGLYDPDGGGRKAAAADMEWYSAAGQLTGDPAELNIEDFWYLAPLDAASQ